MGAQRPFADGIDPVGSGASETSVPPVPAMRGGQFPWGWLGGMEGLFSGGLEEAVAWSAAALPYRAALEGLQRFCGIEVSLSAA